MGTHDNKKMTDALSNDFWVRMSDVSPPQDGTMLRSMILNTPHPIDYLGGGMFQSVSKSGTMAAGLGAAAPILSFRWPSATMFALIRRVKLQAWSMSVGFTAGIATFDLQGARGWSVDDSGGAMDTLTGHNQKRRTATMSTSVAAIRKATTATLTAGTRSKNSQALETETVQVTNAANTVFFAKKTLFEKNDAEHPLVLAQYEGFIIEATVPATGTWAFAVTTEWDEVPVYPFASA